MRPISASESGFIPTKSSYPGSAFHGGITRRLVTSAICVACRRADAYVNTLKGARPPGRWHVAQRSNRIGAISLANVIDGEAASAPADARMQAVASTIIAGLTRR